MRGTKMNPEQAKAKLYRLYLKEQWYTNPRPTQAKPVMTHKNPLSDRLWIASRLIMGMQARWMDMP